MNEDKTIYDMVKSNNPRIVINRLLKIYIFNTNELVYKPVLRHYVYSKNESIRIEGYNFFGNKKIEHFINVYKIRNPSKMTYIIKEYIYPNIKKTEFKTFDDLLRYLINIKITKVSLDIDTEISFIRIFDDVKLKFIKKESRQHMPFSETYYTCQSRTSGISLNTLNELFPTYKLCYDELQEVNKIKKLTSIENIYRPQVGFMYKKYLQKGVGQGFKEKTDGNIKRRRTRTHSRKPRRSRTR